MSGEETRSLPSNRHEDLRKLGAATLLVLGMSVLGVACGGHASSSPAPSAGGAAGAGSSAGGAAGADGGSFPLNAPRRRLACGATNTCFLTPQGDVRCWGTGANGQLGDGSTDEAPKGPSIVRGLSSPVGLIGGPMQTCAFTESDAAMCWGLLPALVTAPTPTPTALDLMATATIAFSDHACAVTRAGDVYCWGPDEFLGNGTGPSEAPTQVAGLHDAIDVATATMSELGSGVATLVVQADGSVFGWGHAHGPGLTDDSGKDLPRPIPMPGLSGVRQITLGERHACALLADATVACWGSNVGGRLGSSTAATLVPQIVDGLTDVAEVRAGEGFTCARRSNGEVWCWGDNTFATLARPKSLPFSRVPLRVDVPPVTQMAVGLQHVCVLASDDQIWCWGSNYSDEITVSQQSTFDTPVNVTP